MYIVYKESDIKQLQQKYLLLEMDTIKVSETQIMTPHCVIVSDNVSLHEVGEINAKGELHRELMERYKNKDWKECEELITKLKGSFKREVDSFYNALSKRIVDYKENGVADNWTNVISHQSAKMGL